MENKDVMFRRADIGEASVSELTETDLDRVVGGGNVNTHGEDSKGLYQINLAPSSTPGILIDGALRAASL
jgi:hypothetical protein